MALKVPGTAREIVESLIEKNDYTINKIAKMLGVNRKTISRIRKGISPLPQTHLNLIQLFITIHQFSISSSVDWQEYMSGVTLPKKKVE